MSSSTALFATISIALALAGPALADSRAPKAPAAPAPAGTPKLPVLALGGLDPVALVGGKEIAGNERFTSTYGRFQYRFANVRSKGAFLQDPERYAIQFGGSCARMGYFSGMCSTQRFAVHGGRIYVFASDGCKATFLQDPARFVDTPAPAPAPEAAAAAAGSILLDQAVVAHGGEELLQNTGGVRMRATLQWNEQGEVSEGTRVLIVGVKDGFATSEAWGAMPDKWSVSAGRGTRCNADGSWPMTRSEAKAAQRIRLLNPLALLMARHDPGFVAQDLGMGKMAGADFQLVACWHLGLAVTLALDPKTHRVAGISWQDGPAGGEHIRFFADYRDVGGLLLPWDVHDLVNGELVQNPHVRVESMELIPQFIPFCEPAA